MDGDQTAVDSLNVSLNGDSSAVAKAILKPPSVPPPLTFAATSISFSVSTAVRCAPPAAAGAPPEKEERKDFGRSGTDDALTPDDEPMQPSPSDRAPSFTEQSKLPSHANATAQSVASTEDPTKLTYNVAQQEVVVATVASVGGETPAPKPAETELARKELEVISDPGVQSPLPNDSSYVLCMLFLPHRCVLTLTVTGTSMQRTRLAWRSATAVSLSRQTQNSSRYIYIDTNLDLL